MDNIELQKFEEASEMLKRVLHHTELDLSSTFSKICDAKVYLKCENRQKTGSFKIRGATYKIMSMAARGEKVPVVASSAGNHAQGVAYAASLAGIPATIVMPAHAPIAKVQATEGYGAKVVLHGDFYDDAYRKAVEICDQEGAKFLHPYNDIEVITGQGTLGLEILEDLPTADVIVVPAGGGGLLAGISCAVKQVNPRVRVIGVQAEGADAIARSFRYKKLEKSDTVSTIADGIAVKEPGDITVELINRYADDVVTVSDSDIASSILMLMERCKMIVEPAGAASVAAVLGRKIDVRGKKVVCVLSGGNMDVSFVQGIIERGLVARHRRVKLTVTLVDKPGSLEKLLHVIAESGANILSIQHDKFSTDLNPNEINVNIACEVGGKEHSKQLAALLAEKGYRIAFN